MRSFSSQERRDRWENNLIVVWRTKGRIYRQGKRVGKDCPITHEERRIYVKQGRWSCIKAVMRNRGINVQEALRLVKNAEGEAR